MFTGDEPSADSTAERDRITNDGMPPSPQDQPDEKEAGLDDWPQQSDDEILDVLIVDDII